MAEVEKLLTTDGILDYPDASNTSKGTTEQQFQQWLKNQNSVTGSMVGMSLWQPSTAYVVGQVIKSPNMNPNTVARVTTAGTTGNAEPVWGAAGATTSDGTVAYLICYEVVDYATQAEVNAGTNNTKIVTPATLKVLLDTVVAETKKAMYPPVGCVLSFADSTDPNVLWKGTNWERFAQGRVLMGARSYVENGVTYTYTTGATGGEVKHHLTTDEMPAHGHAASCSTAGNHYHGTAWENTTEAPNVPFGWYDSSNKYGGASGFHSDHDNALAKSSTDGNHAHTITISSTGGNSAHENRMPYQVVSSWRRTA